MRVSGLVIVFALCWIVLVACAPAAATPTVVSLPATGTPTVAPSAMPTSLPSTPTALPPTPTTAAPTATGVPTDVPLALTAENLVGIWHRFGPAAHEFLIFKADGTYLSVTGSPTGALDTKGKYEFDEGTITFKESSEYFKDCADGTYKAFFGGARGKSLILQVIQDDTCPLRVEHIARPFEHYVESQ